MRYEQLKELAQARSQRVTELIALAPQNDPFYCGTPTDRDQAEWFAERWTRFGYTSGVHLRRIHYQIVSQDPPVLLPKGSPYENTEGCWQTLIQAAKAARYLGRVDPAAFVDRRNPDPELCAWPGGDPTPSYQVTGDADWDRPTLPDLPALPDFHVAGYTHDGYYQECNLQPYHLEVWCEKTTMNDVLLPVCREFGVNLVTGAGELSLTAVMEFLQRVEHAARPAHIFYISDFDPAGLGMPISVARKVEFFQARRADGAGEITLDPLALTREQVQSYRLPRTPIKDTDRRKAGFEDRFGSGAVELDALEALHPGELAHLLRRAIRDYYDPDIDAAARRQRAALERTLAVARAEVLADLEGDLAEVESEYEELRTEFAARVTALADRWAELSEEVADRLEAVAVDLENYPVPLSTVQANPAGALFHSGRDYLDQLEYYQRARRGEGNGN